MLCFGVSQAPLFQLVDLTARVFIGAVKKNINEIQLGNVKNQVLGGASGGHGHHHQGSLLQNSSIGGANQNL